MYENQDMYEKLIDVWKLRCVWEIIWCMKIKIYMKIYWCKKIKICMKN